MFRDENNDRENGTHHTFKSWPKVRGQSWWRNKRLQTWAAVLIVLIVFLSLFGGTSKGRRRLRSAHSRTSDLIEQTTFSFSSHQAELTLPKRRPLTHLLIPASKQSPELCKLLLTTSTLNYPHPHLLTWNETFNKKGMQDGGSHIGKVHSIIEYIDHQGTANDEDLVLIMDGYDTWFQLPSEVLVDRYYEILDQADARLVDRLGVKAMRQVRKEKIGNAVSSRIVFGAGKRCAPNQIQTMACYAVPPSPLPEDLYGGNTDTPAGYNQWTSYRQRYLEAGMMMGPIGEMRRMFSRAGEMIDGPEKLWQTPGRTTIDPMDDGSKSSKYFYHGSDQSIFAKIFGRQEYIREHLRRRWDPVAGRPGDPKMQTTIEGMHFNDNLHPPWAHEQWQQDQLWVARERFLTHVPNWYLHLPSPDLLKKYDFGITLDYFSSLSHQTLNSETDATWLTHSNTPLESQIDAKTRSSYDCPLHLATTRSRTAFPANLLNAPHPSQPRSTTAPTPKQSLLWGSSHTTSPWLQTPLYTHLCLTTPTHATIPAIIHHNGAKHTLARDWKQMAWLYKAARPVLDGPSIYEENGLGRPELGGADEERQGPGTGGAWTDKGYSMSWEQLCPKDILERGEVFGKKRGGKGEGKSKSKGQG